MSTDNAFPKPMLVKEWKEKIKSKRGKKLKNPVNLPLGRVIIPKRIQEKYGYLISPDATGIDFNLVTKEIGKRRFPPKIKTVGLNKATNTKMNEKLLEGFLPNFLNRDPLPKELEKSLERRKWIKTHKKIKKNTGQTTAVFGADERYDFSDTSFPWSTCGRVDTGAGFGSGVMIGPRHLMTASHNVNWGDDNAGWIKFTPLFFDGDEPFGFAFATKVYYWLKADDDSDGIINSDETAFDYVICVLDRRIGNLTGWMGSRGYDTAWNDGDYWAHIGYPGDMSGGQRPSFIGYQKFDDTFERSVSGRNSYGIEHQIDIWRGQSGGPFFGWWEGDDWPRVVGIQSTENWGGIGGPNTCGGGNPLPELINYARTQEP